MLLAAACTPLHANGPQGGMPLRLRPWGTSAAAQRARGREGAKGKDEGRERGKNLTSRGRRSAAAVAVFRVSRLLGHRGLRPPSDVLSHGHGG
eukprot:scaffold125303_cov31-Tisochrysis_lutea.AAC.3